MTADYLSEEFFILCILPGSRNLDLHNVFCSAVDSVIVHLNYLVTLTSVSIKSSLLHKLDGLILGDDVCQFEEC